MRKALLALLLLSACGRESSPAPSSTTIGAAPQPARAPELASCKSLEPLEPGDRIPTTPLAFPRHLAGIVATDPDRIAVATLGGRTWCSDARWIEDIGNVVLSPDQRFLTFDWSGNEAFGHVIIDRSGAGGEIDTGVPPLPSPSGGRIAALDYSDSSYGALNAFAVWEVGPAKLTELVKIEELPQGFDWKIDTWLSDDCLALSMIAWDDLPDDNANYAKAPRQRYVASPLAGPWKLRPVAEAGCPTG
jgi:hypothetical protein